MNSLDHSPVCHAMPNKLLIIKNITHEGPGLLHELLHEHGIEVTIADLSRDGKLPDPLDYKAMLILGGPQSANDETPAMRLLIGKISRALKSGTPTLGICLGLQAIVKAAGGKVLRSPVKEIGFLDPEGNPFTVELTPAGKTDPIFKDIESPFRVFQLHGETVELTGSMQLLGSGRHCTNQVVKAGPAAYGVQCHVELTPEMLGVWAALDSDLKTMDRHAILEQFDLIREEYTRTGLVILNNFLALAGLT
jgi:GMP synthase (glutamine-hydrolysing)